MFAGAAIVFYAYLGFEAVSTAAAESKNPSRDVPVGILGALIVCTLIYMVVAAVMTIIIGLWPEQFLRLATFSYSLVATTTP